MPEAAPAPAPVDRGSVLAEMATLKASQEATEAAPVKTAKPAAAPIEKDEAVDVKDPPSEASAAEPAPEPSDEDEAKPDAETQKRLDSVARAEKRSRQQLSKERQDFEAERREFTDGQRAHRAEVESFSKLKGRAKYDAVAVMRSLGLTEDDFESAAQQLYANSKAAAADPKRKAATEQTARERELRDEVAELRSWRDRKEQADEQRQQQSVVERQASNYLDKLTAQVTDEASPLVKRQIAKNPQKAYAGLVAAYGDLLADSDGDVPEPAHVVKAYETRRRAELDEEGVDIDALLGKRSATPPAKTSRTLSGLNGATRPKPAPSKDPEEARADTLRELATLRSSTDD